jgi:hypothetical protein
MIRKPSHAVKYIRTQRARTLLVREMHSLMSQYDALLSPTLSRSLTITNLTGHPALVLKAGFRDGLPVALMITGRPYEEAEALLEADGGEQRVESGFRLGHGSTGTRQLEEVRTGRCLHDRRFESETPLVVAHARSRLYLGRIDSRNIDYRHGHAANFEARGCCHVRRRPSVWLQHLVGPPLEIGLHGSALAAEVVHDKLGVLRISRRPWQSELGNPQRGRGLNLHPVERRLKLQRALCCHRDRGRKTGEREGPPSSQVHRSLRF